MLLNLTVILLVILLVPLICKPLRLPSIVGYIVVGILLGPYGIGLVSDSSTMQMFGSAGMIYLMFLSGIEIDLGDFRRSFLKSMLFGILTFLIPCIIGVFSTRMLGFGWLTCVLLGSMYGSHTLMTYPVVSRYGLQRNSVVSIVVGGTMLSVMLSLLCLGAVSSVEETGNSLLASLRIVVYLILFLAVVMWLFPKIAAWFIKRNNDSAAEFLLVILLVAVAALVADRLGLQAILGAFVAGVALNRRIPNLSPLMNRISFVGNTFFIPVFLIGVGMLIDPAVFVSGWFTLAVAAVMLSSKLAGKWLAAFLAQRLMRLSSDERRLTFGLSSASAAGTLAVATIGYNIGVLPLEVLNASILLILFSCMVASFVTEGVAMRMALLEQLHKSDDTLQERVLVTLANPQTDTSLVDIALLTASQDRNPAFAALAVCNNAEAEQQASVLLKHAAQYAASAERRMDTFTEVAANTANGILRVLQTRQFNRIVMGTSFADDTSYGEVASHLLGSVSCQMMLYRQIQPLNTVERLRVAVPKYAQQETGFVDVVDRIRNLATQISARVTFYCNDSTAQLLRALCQRPGKRLSAGFVEMEDWEDSLMIAKEMEPNDMLILWLARPATVSYNPLFESVPYVLRKFYSEHNTLILYPEQSGTVNADSLIQDACGTTERVPVIRRLYNRWLTWRRRKQRYIKS
ncbi:MAG: cation:proton antiporter [Paludibacteraceae bacterium]|nr:cation:proton antiporter [Paludibacteraceae bacterium]